MPFGVGEAVGVHACDFYEFVDEFLLYAHGVVGADGVDSPFEAVLFGVVLGAEVGVVEGFDG